MSDYKPLYKTKVAVLLRLNMTTPEEHDEAVSMAKIAGTYETGLYPKVIDAYARSYFAIHHDIHRPSKWKITHVPTGVYVLRGFRTKRDAAIALDYITDESEKAGLEWTFTKVSEASSHPRCAEFQDLMSNARVRFIDNDS